MKNTRVGRFSRAREEIIFGAETECGARILASVGCDRQGDRVGIKTSETVLAWGSKRIEVPKPQPCSNGKV